MSVYDAYSISMSWKRWVLELRLGVGTASRVQRAYTWDFSMWRRHYCGKGLEVCVPNKPIQSPFQIAEGVLESFGPILLLIEALSDRIGFHFVILNLVGQFKAFFRWYVVFLVLGIRKFSKVLEACQEQCHCFVISSAPEQVHRTKQLISIVIVVHNPRVAAHRKYFYSILKLWPEILTHCMEKKAGLTPCSIYLIPLNRNFRKSSKSKIVNGTKFSIMPNRKGIIEHISSFQQLQVCLWNFYLGQNCISFFLLTKNKFHRHKRQYIHRAPREQCFLPTCLHFIPRKLWKEVSSIHIKWGNRWLIKDISD